MHILIVVIIFLLYGINKMVDDSIGTIQDNKKRQTNEFVDPRLYKDHNGFLCDKETDEVMFMYRIDGRLYVSNATGTIKRDITDLEREREKNGQTL